MAVQVSHGGGTQLRALEKVLEDAHKTGKLNLSGRNLRDYPKNTDKYDLLDTVEIDLSKNKLSELPCEMCSYSALQRLNCYNNVIKMVPEEVINLTSLSYLNLSRNQLSALPPQICDLFLEVLNLSNNKLVSLPQEIGKLRTLMLLDASCNELDNLPSEIGEMESLKELNIRRNHLVTLPDEISKLKLVKLDIACNKIQTIPPSFRSMHTLDGFDVDHNPLLNPPAQVCTRGRVHIFKYLATEAIRADKRRGMIEQSEWGSTRAPYNTNRFRWFTAKHTSTMSLQEMPSDHSRGALAHPHQRSSSPSSSSSPHTAPFSSTSFSVSTSDLATASSTYADQSFDPESDFRDEISLFNHKMRDLRSGIKMADSGYLEGDKRWSSSEASNEDEEAKYLAERASQQKDRRQHRMPSSDSISSTTSTSSSSSTSSQRAFQPIDNHIDFIDTGEEEDEDEEDVVTPTQSPVLTPTSSAIEPDAFTKDDELIFYEIQNPDFFQELERQKAMYEEKKRQAREERLRMETEEQQRKSNGNGNHAQPPNNTNGINSRDESGARRLSGDRDVSGARRLSGDRDVSGARRLSSDAPPSVRRTTNGDRDGSGVRRLSGESASRLQKPAAISANSVASKLHTVTNGSSGATTNGTRRALSTSASTTNSIGRPRSLYIDKKVTRRATVWSADDSSVADKYSNSNHSMPIPNGRISRTPDAAGNGVPVSGQQVSPERHKAQVMRRAEIEEKNRTKQTQRDAVLNYYKTRASPSQSPTNKRDENGSNNSRNTPSPSSAPAFGSIKPRSAFSIGGGKPTGDNIQASFTAKRERTKWAEELERIEQLRKSIESRLKVSLPEDLAEALMDGVVLCHIANNLKRNAISSIHVPSPAVPKLTQAKCRRNVDNFLKICTAAGVPQEKLCTPADILEGKGLPKVAAMVRALISMSAVSTKQWAV